jgi:hypothetical protein
LYSTGRLYELAKAVRLIAVTLQSSIGALSDPELPGEQPEIVLEPIGPPLGEVGTSRP